MSSRPLIPGTAGWAVHDLDEPEIEAQWLEGRYEIVDGVLATLPPNDFASACALQELVFSAKRHLKARDLERFWRRDGHCY